MWKNEEKISRKECISKNVKEKILRKLLYRVLFMHVIFKEKARYMTHGTSLA